MTADLLKVHSFVLPEASWAEVDELLALIEAALRDHDDDTAVAAAKELAVFGGTRTRIDGLPTGPIPEPIRERINRLVHDLGKQAPRTPETPQPEDKRAGDR